MAWADIEERSDGVQRQVMDDAGASTEQQFVAFTGRSAVEIQVSVLKLAQNMVAHEVMKPHVLCVHGEELVKPLTAYPHHGAGHHRLYRKLRRTAIKQVGITAHHLAFKRKPRYMVAAVADAAHRIFEIPFLHEGKPFRRLSLLLHLFALLIADNLSVLFAIVVQRFQVNVRLVIPLFHDCKEWEFAVAALPKREYHGAKVIIKNRIAKLLTEKTA